MKISKQDLKEKFKGHIIPRFYFSMPNTTNYLCGRTNCELNHIKCKECAFYDQHREKYTKEEKIDLLLLVQSIYKKYNE